MASSYDPRKRLERLAEKQMKCTLHAKFLEDCLSYELVPNGLTLKLKVSVGNEPEDIELQKSVNVLLERTSLHIVDIVKEGHLRKAKNLGRVIEEERDKLKKELSGESIFEIDSSVFKKTQDRKDLLTAKHQRKLADLTERQTGGNAKGEGDAGKREQKKTEIKVSKQTFSTDSKAKRGTSQQNKPSGKRKKKRKSKKAGQSSAESKNNMSGMENSGKTSIREDVITMFDKKQDSQRSEQTQTKNALAPGTGMRYSEAIICGAKTTAQDTTEKSLQETLQTVVLTMQELIKSMQRKHQRGGSLGAKPEMRGKRQRKGQNRSQEAKRRF